MKYIDVDTSKIYECGKSMVDLSLTLREIITTIFGNIDNLANNNVWLGNSSNSFRSMANVDKIQYLKLQEFLSQSGNYLMQYAETINKLINEVSR